MCLDLELIYIGLQSPNRQHRLQTKVFVAVTGIPNFGRTSESSALPGGQSGMTMHRNHALPVSCALGIVLCCFQTVAESASAIEPRSLCCPRG